MCLLDACDMIFYCETVGQDITASNTHWDPVIKNFDDQWKALSNFITDGVYVLKILNTLSVIKWTEYFSDILNSSIEFRTILMSNVKIDQFSVPSAAPHLATKHPHYTEYGSVEEELLARASYAHPIYFDDN